MIVNSNKLLKDARKSKKVVFQFNINNLEWLKYILEVCDEEKQDIILGFSESAIKYMGGYEVISNLVYTFDKKNKYKNKIVLHLDHGKSIEACKEAVKNGFTSVMYDGSSLILSENIANVNAIRKYISDDISLEAEVGPLGTCSDIISYTRVEDVREFLSKVKVDSLAISIGNVHGVYKGKPHINLELLKSISAEFKIPLVLHGASYIDKETLKETINCGISKINVNTEFQDVWAKEVRKYIKYNKKIVDPRKIISSGEQAIKNKAKEYFNIK